MLDAALICHLGVLIDGVPIVLPTTFAVDLEGPDAGGSLYLHGSVAARSLREGPAHVVSVSVTVLDGLVLARSGFHHSMNYRSAVVIGCPRVVTDLDEKHHAMNCVVDHVVPGRSSTLRPHSRKELAATTVLALALAEASVKSRSGPPADDMADIERGQWAGEMPVRLAAGALVTAPDSATDEPPADVSARLAALS